MENNGLQSRFIGIDALFQYLGSGVQLFSGMIFYIVAVRLFNTADVGAIALLVAIVGIFNIIFSFGLSTSAQHFTSYNIGKKDYASVKSTILKIIGMATLLSIFSFLTLQFLAVEISTIFLHSQTYTTIVRLLSIAIIGNIFFGILNGIILGIQRFKLSAIINIVIWIVYYFGALAFAVHFGTIFAIVYGWIVGIFLGVAIEIVIVESAFKGHHKLSSPTSNILILKYSFPLLLSSIISYGAAYADRFIVSGLLNLSSLGIYNFALLIAAAIGSIANPFNSILMPKFSEFYGSGKKDKIAETVKVSSLLLSFFYIPSALGVAALAPMILNILGGASYLLGVLSIRIIMFFTAIFIIQNIFTQALAAIRQTNFFFYSSSLSMLGNVCFSLILVPVYGLAGAAIGYSSVYGITFLILFYFSKKESVILIDLIGLLKIWVSGLGMFTVVYLLSNIIGMDVYFLPLYVVVGMMIFLMLVRILRIFKKEKVNMILSIFPPNLFVFRKLIMIFVTQ